MYCYISLFTFCGYGLYGVKLTVKLRKVGGGECTHSFMNKNVKNKWFTLKRLCEIKALKQLNVTKLTIIYSIYSAMVMKW